MTITMFAMPSSQCREKPQLSAFAALIATVLFVAALVPRADGFAPSPWNGFSTSDRPGFYTSDIGRFPYNSRHCTNPSAGHQRWSVLFSTFGDTDTDDNVRLLESIRSMRVKELKAELAQRNISSADAFEKEELVQRLYKAKIQTQAASQSQATTTATAPASSPGVLRTNLFFTAVDTDRSMAGIASGTSERVTIRADAGSPPYPTAVLDVHDTNGNVEFSLRLLVDTACSGLVLRPSVVRQHPSSLKSYSTPVTMTGGAGAAASTGLTQIESCSFAGTTAGQKLGPLPAAVQDIGALPMELDGIIGLSVLGRYACAELDLDNGCMTLYENEFRPPLDNNGNDDDDGSDVVVAEAELSPTKLGIWTVDMSVSVGGAISKPVKMLVDTGAMSTFLTHKGLEQTGLPTACVKDLTLPTGAMGSDNVAMSLTKRIELDADADAPIVFGKRSSSSNAQSQFPGLSLSGASVPVDIGSIGILDDQLASDNVVGILGMDVLSRASRIRVTVRGPIPRLTLYQKQRREQQPQPQPQPQSSSSTAGDSSTGAPAEPREKSTAAADGGGDDEPIPATEGTAADVVPPRVEESEEDVNEDPVTRTSSPVSSSSVSPEPTPASSVTVVESVSSETETEQPPRKKKKKKKRRYD